MRLQDFVLPEHLTQFNQYLEEIQSKGAVAGLVKFRYPNGGVGYLEYRNRLIAGQGEAPYVIGSARDITKRVALDQEREQLQKELDNAKRLESLGILAGGIAHDFNNILAITLGYAEAACRTLEDGAIAAGDITPIVDASLRGKELVRRILAFSRQQDTQLKPVDMNRVVEAARDILAHTLPKTIEVLALPDPVRPLALADEGQIEQMLMNLGANAADAMPHGGRLRLSTRLIELDEAGCRGLGELAPGRYASLVVTDDGLGMEREVVEHIFEPFFTTKEIGKGTGLGLASVYGIVKAHHGHITCSSRPAHGTSFTIYLPSPPPGMAAPQPEGPAASAAPTGHETVLIVDDEDALVEVMAKTVATCGYTVLTAANGAQALQRFQEAENQVDLVVMDLNMPVMDGARAIEKLMALKPGVKVLVASGYPGERQALDIAGVAGLIAKPFSARELLDKIRQVLDQAAA